jgi:hypothetical protein
MYKNNWLTWSYDGNILGNKTHPLAKFELDIKPTISKKVQSYYNELVNNAKLIRDNYTGKFDLLLSGGVDSEVILRIYHSLGVPINVFIFQYENNYNYRDVAHAKRICQELNVSYKLIDFNLQQFVENDAYDLWHQCYSKNVARLPHLKMLDYLDNIPIIGTGEPEWHLVKNKWLFELSEGSFVWQIHQYHKGRTVLADWYNYSPEVTASYMQQPIVRQLANNKFPEHTTTVTFKGQIHQQYWPSIQLRPKLVGFEGNNVSSTIEPEFMRNFNQKYIDNRETGAQFYYTPAELTRLLYVESET